MSYFSKKYLKRRNQFRELGATMAEQGYVILNGFFDAKDLSAFDAELKYILANRNSKAGNMTIDVLDGPLMQQRLLLQQAPEEALFVPYKINDMYLESEACLNLNLNHELRALLKSLLDGLPMVVNSLSFTQGSQQPHHFDYYYMPPFVQDKMVVSSICLENQTEDSGPVSYYPESHKIPPYRFSDGGVGVIADEMDRAKAYTLAEIEKRGLVEESFIGKAGDVFLWHGSLYHRGRPILNTRATRKTLVTHYWRSCDVAKKHVAKTSNGGLYFTREHAPANSH